MAVCIFDRDGLVVVRDEGCGGEGLEPSYRANAKTPTLIEMQRALSQMHSDQATKFAYWQKFCWETEDLPIGFMLSMMLEKRSNMARALGLLRHKLGVRSPFRTALAKAYDAPFPDPSYKMGPRAMPSYVPTLPNDPSLEAQRQAWEFFSGFDKPFLCAFADNDPVTGGLDAEFLEKVPGTKGLPHVTIKGGGHFVQENCPDQVVGAIVGLVRST